MSEPHPIAQRAEDQRRFERATAAVRQASRHGGRSPNISGGAPTPAQRDGINSRVLALAAVPAHRAEIPGLALLIVAAPILLLAIAVVLP